MHEFDILQISFDRNIVTYSISTIAIYRKQTYKIIDIFVMISCTESSNP